MYATHLNPVHIVTFQIHWDISSFDWDGPQDVGDQLEIGFQVANLVKSRFTKLVTTLVNLANLVNSRFIKLPQGSLLW